jgi:hypothetical protein
VQDLTAEQARELVAKLMEDKGLTIEAVFVPWSASRNAPGRGEGLGQDKDDGWRSLNWRVTLKHANGWSLTTDYSQGEGHCPAVKDKYLGAADCVDRQNAILAECETGRTHGKYTNRNKPILPNPVDVFASLINDSDVLNSSTFEDWAANFGYSEDSRKAEAIYQACLKLALALRNALGDDVLTEARGVAQQL